MLKDRVKVHSSTTGTGDFTLSSAFLGYQSFEDGQYYYVIDDLNGNWEYGLGQVSSTTLVRGVLKSSNSNNLVNFTVASIVYIDIGADQLASAISNSLNRVW